MNWLRRPKDEHRQGFEQHTPTTIVPLPNLLDTETGWHRRWYFTARLGDEINHARKSRQKLTLIFFRLPLSAWEPNTRFRIHLVMRLDLIEREVRRENGIFGRLSEDEFAISITGTNRVGAAATAAMVRHRLEAIAAEISVVVFPDAADNRTDLLKAARAGLVEKPPVKVVSLQEFRRPFTRTG